MKRKPLSSLTRWGWAAGGIADNLLFGSVSALTLPVCNLHFGIDPRWVGAALLVLTALLRYLTTKTLPSVLHMAS